MNRDKNQNGFTLVEIVIGITVLGIVIASFAGLFVALVNSSLVAKRKAVANSLATNQIEYLKSLPYDDLAVNGGSIPHSNPLDASKTETVDGFEYIVNTSINFVDNAFDGCGDYPSQEIKEQLCRSYPPPASVTTNDTNPADYKILHVSVENASGDVFAKVDTQVAAKVAETDSATGALVVSVIDGNGNPIQGANVNVVNSSVSPSIDVNDSTDSNGVAIFYNLPPDSGFDYRVTGSKINYSTLGTISISGSLQPTFPDQNILTQQSSQLTLTLLPQGAHSLVLEAVDTNGAPVAGLSIFSKGGYKKFNDSDNTEYYFNNTSPSDSRPSTDANGLVAVSNLVPGPYFFCGDNGATLCSVGNTDYYLISAIPHSGSFPLSTVVPTFISSEPPSPLFSYSGQNYYQKTSLVLSTDPLFPRVHSISNAEVSISTDDLTDVDFSVNGRNLPCHASNPSSCATSITILQNSNTYNASCIGSTDGSGLATLNCNVDLTGVSAGATQFRVSSGGRTYTSPIGLVLGSINVKT